MDYMYVPSAFFMVVLLCSSPSAMGFFGHRHLVWLGKMSFSVYVLHFPLSSSVGVRLFLELYDRSSLGYHASAVIAEVVFLGLVYALSIPYERYVDRAGVSLSFKLYSFFTLNY